MRIPAGIIRTCATAILLSLPVLSTGCAPGRAKPTTPQAGWPVLLDQRLAGGGFAAPRRAPRPRRHLQLQPSLLSATRGILLPALTPAVAAPSTPLSSFLQLGMPKLGAPPKVAPLPPRPGCGYVKVGARQIPLDCATPSYGLVQSAAEPLVHVHRLRKSEWHAGAAELPSYVDHRVDGEEEPLGRQDQGLVHG